MSQNVERIESSYKRGNRLDGWAAMMGCLWRMGSAVVAGAVVIVTTAERLYYIDPAVRATSAVVITAGSLACWGAYKAEGVLDFRVDEADDIARGHELMEAFADRE